MIRTATALLTVIGVLNATLGDTTTETTSGETSASAHEQLPVVNIDKATLRGLAEQSLTNSGLSEESYVGDLWTGIVERTEQMITLRQNVNATHAALQKLTKELETLQAFVRDHAQFGDDFASYETVIAETQKLTRAKNALKRQQAQFERDRHRESIRKKKEEERQRKLKAKSANKRLEKLGFTPVGDDVYLSKSAYAYAMRNVPEQRVFYQPSPTGEVQQLTTVENREEIDYTKMTISGSLLNADAVTRNIGVAFVFRDAHGNQIGQETVVIENARPEVPYPFTGELVMASDQPFSSMTSWVLFADAATPPAATPPAATPPAATPPAATPPAATPPAASPPSTP